jgi:hypothetical protein
VRHPLWGTIGLPIWSWLYIRQKDVCKIPAKHGWKFQTKLEQAFDLVLMTAETLLSLGKELWIVTDGAYAKKPFVGPALEVGATLVGRLRKDSSLWSLPPKERTRRRGRKRKYGKNRISPGGRRIVMAGSTLFAPSMANRCSSGSRRSWRRIAHSEARFAW